MNLPESAVATLAPVLLILLGAVVAIAGDWLRGRWTHQHAKGEITAQARADTDRQLYAERMVVYRRFRQNINAVLDAMMNAGYGHIRLLYAVRDDFEVIRQTAPAAVVAAAKAAIDVLKPLIDVGPADERFARFTRALKQFEDACRADSGLDPLPKTTGDAQWRQRREQPRQEFSVLRPNSEILDQSDDEAAFNRIFLEAGLADFEAPPKELTPRR